MDLVIRANDVTVTPEIQTLADRHSGRLDRIVERIDDAKLELRRQSQRSGGEVTIAQITVRSGKATLRAEERDRDVTKAIDNAFTKLERQVRRHHERRADRHGPRDIEPSLPPVESDGFDEDEDEAEIVRTKRFALKPMDLDEAIEQMHLLGHDFFLFQNVEGNAVNLIYRRRDGKLGLLIPESM